MCKRHLEHLPSDDECGARDVMMSVDGKSDVEGASDSEVNSTEISTDSEFDDEQPQRVPPTFHLEFKPLVEVDPTIKLVQAGRAPLAVPRAGDYGLSKTASTEGIASKKSLELKKKYLLGEGSAGLGVLKSGSASALDSKFKTFHSNITECQKLLNPAAQGSTATPSVLRPGVAAVASAGQPDGRDVTKQQHNQHTQQTLTSLDINEDTEKENQYRAEKSIANGSNGNAAGVGVANRLSLVETINSTLVENKFNETKSGGSFQPVTKEQGVLSQPTAERPEALPRHLMNAKQHNGQTESGNNRHDSNRSPGVHLHNNNNNNNDDGNMEIIDLVTPDKTKGADGHPAATPGRTLVEKGNELKYIANLKHAFLDLTTDSPNCDRSLVETTLDFSIAPSNVNGDRAAEQSDTKPGIVGTIRIDSNENKIDAAAVNGSNRSTSLPKKEQLAPQQKPQPQGEDGCHETTLQVPTVPWATKEEEEDDDEAGIESDSISESGSNESNRNGSSSSNSTSSVEDIPHFILDSTTSPETQNDERFVPRLEVRDATGELMQIDSLMIIDGRYIGDPEDLKLMEQLPPDTQIAAQMLQEEINQDSINTVVEGPIRLDGDELLRQAQEETADDKQDIEEQEEDEDRAKTPTPPMIPTDAMHPAVGVERISPLSDFVTKRNTGFKFDTKNENKIDTLRNLPFVLEAERSITGKPALQKPKYLNLTHHKPADVDTDNERTPMANEPATHGKSLPSPVVAVMAATVRHNQKSAPGNPAEGDGDSDSQDDTELTTQNNLTETELSDWAADDAVSENFVDIEFALNANKGGMRRNQKLRQARLPQQKRLVNGKGSGSTTRTGPGLLDAVAGPGTATEDGIIRNLALEDIEFMDTGSEEESCIETYSTTNRMMLRNRGYVEIMDPRVESTRTIYPPMGHPPAHHGYGPNVNMPLQVVEAINKQIAGRVDYIEQGSYLLGTDDIKTPMNEEPSDKINSLTLVAQSLVKLRASDDNVAEGSGGTGDNEDAISTVPAMVASADHQSCDIEEDSLVIVVSSHDPGSTGTSAMGTTMTGSTTTTEESEALTMVGVVADSSASSEVSILPRGTGEGSSSGRGSVTSFSSSVHDGKIRGFLLPDYGKPVLPIRKVSVDSIPAKRTSLERKEVRRDSLKRVEDVGYEEYVKRLQHKIQQISNARDSLEVKKFKRKSSKGELVPDQEEDASGPGVDEPSTISPQETDSKFTGTNGMVHPNELSSDSWVVVGSVEPPKSVEKKMEEIAKERVKQKDIIHDLVMDKLQTKKQLNAEKRLNRSRNRNNAMLVSSSPGGVSSLTVQQVVVERNTDATDHRTVPSVDSLSSLVATTEVPERSTLVVSNKPHHNVYAGSISMFRTGTEAGPKPVSDSSVGCHDTIVHHFSNPSQQLATPRPQASSMNTNSLISGQPLTTDQLREEARSRARLKSNQDLGLSPEDRLLLLRKKYHINLRGLTDDDDEETQLNQSDDVKSKEQHRSKLITSKSVNDVSLLKQHHHQHPSMRLTPDDLHSPMPSGKAGVASDPSQHPVNKLTDCVSDPNLCVHSAAANEAGPGGGAEETPLRTRNKRKDRERRKSIIEKVSEFFNGRKKASENGAGSSKDTSPTKDGLSAPTTVGSGSSNSGGGGFLRFKISPKLKDKSKEKEGPLYGRRASEDCLNSNVANGSPLMGTAGDTTGTAYHNSYKPIGRKEAEELEPPPIPPLPLNYQQSDDEFGTLNEPNNEFKKMRAMSKTSRQAELKRLRMAQEIQREQEQIEVQINDLEARGVEIEKELRGESETLMKNNVANLGANDDGLVKEWLELMSSITRLKVRDDELNIRQQELQLEHRHAQLKEELNMRLSFGKLDKNSSDVAAEGAILNEMLEIVAKRQALRPSLDASAAVAGTTSTSSAANASPNSRVTKDTNI